MISPDGKKKGHNAQKTTTIGINMAKIPFVRYQGILIAAINPITTRRSNPFQIGC